MVMSQQIKNGEARRLHRAHGLEKLSFAKAYGHGGAYWLVTQFQGSAADEGRVPVVLGTAIGYVVDMRIGMIDHDSSTGYELPESHAFYTSWDLEIIYRVVGSRGLPEGAPPVWVPTPGVQLKGLHLYSILEPSPIYRYVVADHVIRRAYVDLRIAEV